MTHLPDGDIGLLFEGEGYQKIGLVRFGEQWLGGGSSVVPVRLGAAGDATPARPEIKLTAVLDAIYPDGKAGIICDQVAPVLRITNTGNVGLSNLAVTGNVDHLEDCDLPDLEPGESALCRDARHVITDDDQSAGVYTPTLTVTGQDPGGSVVSSTARAESVDLSH